MALFWANIGVVHLRNYKHSLRSLFVSGGGGRRREEMASSLTIKESFKGKYSTCKTSAGVNPASIFQRNPFQNFFHSIFFPGKSLVKNSKLTFNFTWKSPIKFFLHFLQGNPFTFFSKITLFRIFFKNPLQEGVFENSWKFFQLVQNLTQNFPVIFFHGNSL